MDSPPPRPLRTATSRAVASGAGGLATGLELLVTCLLLLAVSPGAMSAQGPGAVGPNGLDFRVRPGVVSPVPEADARYFAGDASGALELLDAHLKAVPDDYEVLWRAVRSLVVMGVQEQGSRLQNQWLDPAMELADRAVAVVPDGLDALYWRGAAYGRRAMNAAPRYATELVQRMYDDAHAILERDPRHGGAHNLLGKLNYEVMSLSRLQRAVGRIFMGNEALSNASWDRADHHLRLAVEHWPELVLFRYDLALLLDKRGSDDEARAAFERVLEVEAVHPTDLDMQGQARAYLEGSMR